MMINNGGVNPHLILNLAEYTSEYRHNDSEKKPMARVKKDTLPVLRRTFKMAVLSILRLLAKQ